MIILLSIIYSIFALIFISVFVLIALDVETNINRNVFTAIIAGMLFPIPLLILSIAIIFKRREINER
jgi:hypothetical protein